MRDAKVQKIKEFMEQLLEVGIIIRTKDNRKNFDLYCAWAGGSIITRRIGNRILVACVNPAIQDSQEMLQKIYALAADLL